MHGFFNLEIEIENVLDGRNIIEVEEEEDKKKEKEKQKQKE